MANEDNFRLPGSSYEELAKIIQGWWMTDGPSPNSDVGRKVGVADTTVSRNNAFLEALGVVEGTGRLKQVSALGKRLGRALHHQHEEEIRRGWADAVDQSSFLTDMLAAVRIRGGMDDSALTRHIAFSAGQKSDKKSAAGLRTVIRILEESRRLISVDGTYQASTEDPSAQSAGEPHEPAPGPQRATTATSPASASLFTASWRDSLTSRLKPDVLVSVPQAPGSSVSISVEIRVNASPGDLAGLADEILEFRRRLDDPEASVEDDES